MQTSRGQLSNKEDKMAKSTNTGIDNTGYWNSGYCNSGNGNSGYCNSGDWNSGYWNSGNGNSGYCNSGDWNSGYWNSGYWNSGYWNSGNWNSGNGNSGNWNSGYCNSGDWNSGAFNRDCPRMRLFEKDLDITVEEFYEKYDISMDIPLNRWIDKKDMTDKEKSEISGWETMGGYLKTLDFKEACQIWWQENPTDHDRFLNLPGFDWAIFADITGIKPDTARQDKINIEGKEYTIEEIKKALKK